MQNPAPSFVQLFRVWYGRNGVTFIALKEKIRILQNEIKIETLRCDTCKLDRLFVTGGGQEGAAVRLATSSRSS